MTLINGLTVHFSELLKTFKFLKGLEEEYKEFHVAFEYAISFNILIGILTNLLSRISINDFIINFITAYNYIIQVIITFTKLII